MGGASYVGVATGFKRIYVLENEIDIIEKRIASENDDERKKENCI